LAAFLLSLLPQFTAGRSAAPVQFVLLGAVFCVMTFLWLGGCALLIDRARREFGRCRLRRGAGAVAGGALIAFGVRLAAAQRP
jgi:threonine/homoserine/homoserine lactone efflux protein